MGGFSIFKTKSHSVRESTSGNSWSKFSSTTIIFNVGGSMTLVIFSSRLRIEDNSLSKFIYIEKLFPMNILRPLNAEKYAISTFFLVLRFSFELPFVTDYLVTPNYCLEHLSQAFCCVSHCHCPISQRLPCGFYY